MKYILVIGDGMSDDPIESLGNKTPLEALDLPAMGVLAGSETGCVQTVPAGVPAGSDTAILNIFGNDPRDCYTGRSVLEAAGVDVTLKPGEVSMRVNLCAVEEIGGRLIIHSHNGGNVEGDDAEGLMKALVADARFAAAAKKCAFTIEISRTFRHIGVFGGPVPDDAVITTTEPHNVLEQPVHYPTGYLSDEIRSLMELSYQVLKDHPINRARIARGQLPANMIWPWGAGRAMCLPDFREKYGVKGTVVSAVPLVWGIACLMGLDHPHIEGATGDLDTNYEGKVEAAIQALKNGSDFAAIHVEAPDEMTHAGDLEKKIEAIRRLDRRVIAPLLERLPKEVGDFRILMLSDHKTLMSTRTHDGKPVPFAIYDSRRPGTPSRLDESTAAASGLFIQEGHDIMARLLERI